jgi:hypothetical protein
MLKDRSKPINSAEVGRSSTTYEPSKTDHLQALNQVVRGAILSDGTFKSYVFLWGFSGFRELTILRILYQIQKLNTYNLERDGAINHSAITNTTPGPHSHLACQTLDLLLSRLLGQPPIAQTWVEKIVVTRLWISSLSLHVQDHPSKLENLFDDIARTDGTRLGLEATHAAQSVSGKSCVLHHPKSCSDITIADMESCHCSAAVIGRG